MPQAGELPYLREIVILLVSAVMVVTIFHRFRVSSVLGYLLVGAFVGPYGLQITSDVTEVQHLAELGVVFLLFTIGLELSLDRLWQMRRLVFGLGSAQVVFSASAIGFIVYKLGYSLEAAVVLGACFSLSSTAMVMQLLVEGGEFSTKTGRSAFAILLLQDLVVVPILFLVNVFGSQSSEFLYMDLAMAGLKALGALAGILIMARLFMRPLFKAVAGTRSPELFMAMNLLAILGTALVTGRAGLSMAMGAFLAGLLLAETEFRHQIETDIKPFKGLLLGLFFVSVGMGINFHLVMDQYKWIALAVFSLIMLKSFIIFILCLVFGQSKDVAFRVASLMGQGGEFAFVVIGIANALGILDVELAQFMLVVATLSMVVTPFFSFIGKRLMPYMKKVEVTESPATLRADPDDVSDLEGHVILAGFGRVGRTVAALLEARKINYVGLDLDVKRLTELRKHAIPVFYGDASRIEVLEKIHVEKAAAMVITIDNPAAARRTVQCLQEHYPTLPIFVRGRDLKHTQELIELGATLVVPETVESSLQLAGQVIHALGTPIDAVNQMIEQIRDTKYTQLYSLKQRVEIEK